MTTTREVEYKNNEIELGKKTTLELSNTKRKKLGLCTSNIEIKDLRKQWEVIVNTELEKHGFAERIDHRSLKDQGAERQPTIKIGWRASAMERRGVLTDRGDINRDIKADNEKNKKLELDIYLDRGRLSVNQIRSASTLDNAAAMSGIGSRYAQWKANKEKLSNPINHTIAEENEVNIEPAKDTLNLGLSL